MLPNREGQTVPQVVFKVRRDGAMVDLDSRELFAGKTVIVFALPGAFTPTCSATHLPRYNELAPTFKANGVDDILCLAVNDAFVMDAWAADQGADAVTLIPDGNGEFTRAMGMLVDKSDLGFGPRSWRYSMLVRDGIIVKQFIEPEEPGDPFHVSDADTLLNYINPQAQQPAVVAVITKPGCPHCAKAKALLKEHGLRYAELSAEADPQLRSVRAITTRATVPQVFIDGRHIGGAEELERYFNEQPGRAA